MRRWILALVVLGLGCAHLVAGESGSFDLSSDAATLGPIAIEFENEGAVLRGRVFLPDDGVDVPGVVILGGSERGPQTSMKSRLAEHFADAGIAALIYDSPGTGRSTGNAMLQTRDDRAIEALAAVRCLREQEGVGAAKVGIMGISEGALITMLAAARDESVAFAIPVSGAFGVPMLEIARYRIETKGLALGLDAEELQKAMLLEEILYSLFVGPERFEWHLIEMKASQWPQEPWEDLIGVVRTMRDAASEADRERYWSTLKESLSFWRSEAWFELAVVELDRFDALMSVSASQFYVLLEHGPLGAGDYDKVEREIAAYPKVRCPVLAVWGDQDEYLPPRRSEAFLRKCLGDAGHEDATYVIVGDASHILIVPGSDDQFVEGYPEVLAEWIGRRFGGRDQETKRQRGGVSGE